MVIRLTRQYKCCWNHIKINKEGVMIRPTWKQTNPLLTRMVTLEDIMGTKQDRNGDDYGIKSTKNYGI